MFLVFQPLKDQKSQFWLTIDYYRKTMKHKNKIV